MFDAQSTQIIIDYYRERAERKRAEAMRQVELSEMRRLAHEANICDACAERHETGVTP